MEDIFKLLNIQALNEEDQEKIKQKLQDIIDIKVNEQVAEKLQEEKEALIEKYETKFDDFADDYKKELVENLSNFIDKILETDMVIPEPVLEWARKGELYHDAIETLKTKMAIDEEMIDSEAKELLREAKEEIDEKESKINELFGKNLEMEKDLRVMAAELYVRKQTDGLSEAKKLKAINLLAGVTDKEEIDRKLKIIIGDKEDINEDKKDAKIVNEDLDDAEGKGHTTVISEEKKDKSSPWTEWLNSTMASSI